MRDLVFRAKAINRDDPKYTYRSNYKNGDWVYGLLEKHKVEFDTGILPAEMKDFRGISGIEVDEDTLGQYAGLCDVAGEDLYEGASVEFLGMIGKVAFEYGAFGIRFEKEIAWGKNEKLKNFNSRKNNHFISFYNIMENFENLEEVKIIE